VDAVAAEEEVTLDSLFASGCGVDEMDSNAALWRRGVAEFLDAGHPGSVPELDLAVWHCAYGVCHGLDEILPQHAAGVDVGPESAQRGTGSVRHHLDVADLCS
jgi:hypothetical protein